MIYIATGILGFAVLFLQDRTVARNNVILRITILMIGTSLIFFSLSMICFFSERIVIHTIFRWIGIIFAPFFILLGIYSILIEIPLKARFKKKGAGAPLITTGTYALSRHPGVLWFSLAMIGLFLIFPSFTMLYAIPLWIIADIIHVFFQERCYFNAIFGEKYKQYKETVPFIIPNAKSSRECIRTLFE